MKKKGWFSVLQNLSWLTQLGLSLAAPPVLCLLGAGLACAALFAGAVGIFRGHSAGLGRRGVYLCGICENVPPQKREKVALYGRKTRRSGRRPEAGAGCDRLFMKIQEATKRETLHIAAARWPFRR